MAPALPVIPLATLVFQCPESPAWLMKKMRYVAAFESLSRLRNSDLQAAREVYAAYILAKTSRTAPATKPSFGKQFLELYSVPRIRRATLASFSVMISQQLCGINIISFYSSSIFLDAGFSRFGALLTSVLFGLVNFFGRLPRHLDHGHAWKTVSSAADPASHGSYHVLRWADLQHPYG